MNITKEQAGSELKVNIEGCLDSNTAGELEEVLEGISSDNFEPRVLDMGGVKRANTILAMALLLISRTHNDTNNNMLYKER